jgi:hypothetical protein
MSDRAVMGRVANAVNIVLFVLAAAAFVLGLRALGDRRDVQALYFLLVGAIALRSATDMLRPRSSSR